MAAKVILACMASYFLGSIPFSYIVARMAKGVDLRVVGEGNVGGRNVWHVVGKKYGVIAGLLDVSKGFLAYWIGFFLGLSPWWYIWLCGFFVVLGHGFPIFLKGRGGKGAASAMGFLLAMEPLIIVISGLLIAALYLSFRRFHLAIGVGMASIPILWWAVLKKPWPELMLLLSFLFLLGIKRLVDEPYMRRIKQLSGW
jgi:glycerol-3-phosphate acyltransferase PlsY